MAKGVEKIAKEPASLPKAERLVFAETDDSKADQLWEEEIQDRIQAVDAGVAVGVSYGDVIKEVLKRLMMAKKSSVRKFENTMWGG